jgi:Na+:H+ antiporter, NhaA family
MRDRRFERKSWPRYRSGIYGTVGSRLYGFLRMEEASALLIVGSAAVALLWANSPMRDSYHQLWNAIAGITIGEWELAKDLRHWVNDGFMALFFLVVALAIKREIISGELAHARTLATPAIAAFGGMLVPAAVYLLLSDQSRGWGITLTTDIALALGALRLAAPRAPGSLRSFLLTLALLDVTGAAVVMALFYSDEVVLEWVLLGIAIVLLIWALRMVPSSSLFLYVVLGAALWIALDQSGIHPAITGVLLGVLTPARPRRDPTGSEGARWAVHEAALQPDTADAAAPYWLSASETSRRAVSPQARVESVLHPWTSRVIMPTFVIANGGVELNAEAFDSVVSPVGAGIVAGLVIGKPLGIGGGVWIARLLGLGRLPIGVAMPTVLGAAALAGIGYSIALLMTEVSFEDSSSTNGAKLAVIIASLVAALVGALILRSHDARGDRSISRTSGAHVGRNPHKGRSLRKEDDHADH